ncbi:hypothetical protein I3842_14G132300 [Carya illinoinensis]|uniref:peroxidase n=1 Tax=Carya illinoinensis TaxID=32201 RepID=A0A922DBH4_CARIL|nr:hypothetical protein I3842_14G132300 [Carya illinoinensis]
MEIHTTFSDLCIEITVLVARSQLTTDFYKTICPNLLSVVRKQMINLIKTEMRMAASLLRLHFHDCIVNGCDASILLDGTDIRGIEVVGQIKSSVENSCSVVVSCADIPAIAARDASGGPSWKVLLGRRDALLPANQSTALDSIISKFAALGGHTIGLARCTTFSNRLFDSAVMVAADSIMDASMASDFHYFQNLLNGKDLLSSDQILVSGDVAAVTTTKSLVQSYSNNFSLFSADFANSMIKMGNFNPFTDTSGEIRKSSCRAVNSS